MKTLSLNEKITVRGVLESNGRTGLARITARNFSEFMFSKHLMRTARAYNKIISG